MACRLRCAAIPAADDSEFPLENIPFGVVSVSSQAPTCATRIGDYAVDLSLMAQRGLIDGAALPREAASRVFSKPTLNEFIALGHAAWLDARSSIQTFFSSPDTSFDDVSSFVHHVSGVLAHLPIAIGDYTDFYASKEHATNVGTMFRGKDNALQPNWTWMPIGYHGRASSIVVSGTPIHRPWGQTKPPGDAPPVFQPCQKLDFELEMAFVVGKNTPLGAGGGSFSLSDNSIFGVVLMNDWSARDIQAWEYVPLGPFLGKSFGTTISPWIVTMDALKPFETSAPLQDPAPLSHLAGSSPRSTYDIELSIRLGTAKSTSLISRSNLKFMYWTFAQMLAHHSSNGCNMRVGDLCGTGTISGPTLDSLGSLLEMSWNGQHPVALEHGESRTFLLDGDTVLLEGVCRHRELGYSIGFGGCHGKVLPPSEDFP